MIFSVAPGVKMKARFETMTQSNMSTGWQRDIRCLGNNSEEPVWEWGRDNDGWNKWVWHCELINKWVWHCELINKWVWLYNLIYR